MITPKLSLMLFIPSAYSFSVTRIQELELSVHLRIIRLNLRVRNSDTVTSAADVLIGYLKKVVAAMKEAGKSDEEIKKFQTGVQNYFTKVIKPNFKDYDFYVGESMDTDGM
jgi:hypothetical protein